MVSYARLIQQHKHRNHDEYRWCTGNMNIIDVIKNIIILIVIIIINYYC
jgi:hypothetical protein